MSFRNGQEFGEIQQPVVAFLDFFLKMLMRDLRTIAQVRVPRDRIDRALIALIAMPRHLGGRCSAFVWNGPDPYRTSDIWHHLDSKQRSTQLLSPNDQRGVDAESVGDLPVTAERRSSRSGFAIRASGRGKPGVGDDS